MSFNPTEIIFCPTSACNLSCKHCFVKRTSSQNAIKLDYPKAQNIILQSCSFAQKNSSICNIERIGFSGGEPFLNLEFLLKTIKTTVECDLFFDKIMTNGVWWETQEELTQTLQKVYDAGFDGKIGLSFDKFHQDSFGAGYVQKIALFIEETLRIWQEPEIIEIQSVVFHNETETNKECTDCFIESIEELAKKLSCNTVFKTDKKTGTGLIWLSSQADNFKGVASNKNNLEDFLIPIERTPLSRLPHDEKGWQSKKWFTDDFCESTGQVLFVHANGKIAPCCGFANEEEALIIGTLDDSLEEILQNAKHKPLVQICYNTGLASWQKSCVSSTFLGKTDDMCMFCQYVAKNFFN